MPAHREAFSATVPGGELRGWVSGDGEPVVLLHGGPGLPHDYMEAVADDLGDGMRVASYQQRGLPPSTVRGPFGISQELADFASVLDALGWERAWVVGHSWGGHLALRLCAAHPGRLRGVLAVDAIGVAGDGGRAAFNAELGARLPPAAKERVAVLDALDDAGSLDEAGEQELMDLLWPAYFGDPSAAPAAPALRLGHETSAAIVAELSDGLEPARAAIAAAAVPVALLAGAASPIPWGQASRATADLSAHVALTVVPHAGHFVWIEAPGSVGAALRALIATRR